MNGTETLDRDFRARGAQEAFSGVVLIIYDNDELYGAAYGSASRAWRVRNTLGVGSDTASITKLFTSVATLQVIDRGAFALDTKAVDFLGLHGAVLSPEVTVFHLLAHSSGIGDDWEEEGEFRVALWRTKPDYSITLTAERLPRFVHQPTNFPPGEGCRYCNCSWILLGLMIERASGTSYRDYVRKHVFASAGMEHSDCLRPTGFAKR